MACLEVERGRSVEEMRVVGRRVEGNDYPPHCLNVFKISNGYSLPSCLDVLKIWMEMRGND